MDLPWSYLLPFGTKGFICESLSREEKEPLAMEYTKGTGSSSDHTHHHLLPALITKLMFTSIQRNCHLS